MRFNPIPLIAGILLLSFSSAAQDSSRYTIRLKGHSFIPASNISAESLDALENRPERINNKLFLIVQFNELPGESEKAQLKSHGITLLDYIPGYAYTAILTTVPDLATLNRLKIRAFVEPSPKQKMQPGLADGIFPSHAVKVGGTVDLWLSYPSLFSSEEIKKELAKLNIQVLSSFLDAYRIIAIRISQSRLTELAGKSFVEYLEPLPHDPVLLNNKTTSNSRANVLQSSVTGQRNLKGEGVAIGIGDNATTTTHGDFTGRVIDRAAASGGAHGVHVTGIAAGAGIVNEKFTGYAPKATIISQIFNGVILYSNAYVQDHGMVITNNSYGNIVNECSSFGQYSLYSRLLDQHAFQFPNLQHVFAAGNSGTYSCSPYPATFANVLGDYQSSKNVLTVGSTSETGSASDFSSRGPVKDGRIKPEIVSQGGLVFSSWPVNIYSSNNGTSMAAPGVSGGLALLYQRYRQLNGNANPENGLMKALACNGATDLGNPGPDFTYGFGWMNLLRSVIQLESGHYYSASITTGAEQNQSISVPANTAQLKVMLYWNDPEANLMSAQTLVNDLDLELLDPNSSTLFPFKLDTIPANVNNPAGTGADHINNIEQVVVNNPDQGNYVVKIKGTSIVQNSPQKFYVVYDIIPVSTTLTYPMGGEKLKPADSVYISWDSYGDPVSTFTLEYSLNGGGSWVVIDNAIPAATRLYKWFLPNVFTNQARIRVTRNVNGMQSEGQNFVILGAPAVSLSAVQCPGYIALSWPSVTGATDYEIMLLQQSGIEMQSVGITTGNTYTISGLSKDSFYYASVRARYNGSPGFRETFVSLYPNTGTCTGNISDNDIAVDSLVYPDVSGRMNTSSVFTNSVPIRVRIKNLDDVNTPGAITVSYSINGNTPVVEILPNPSIAGGATLVHEFATTADLSAIGTYIITVSVSQAGDNNLFNNSVITTVKQLENAVIDLTSTFIDDLETAPVFSNSRRRTGLDGLDRYDFITSNPNGRVRSFVNTGIAYSGNRALTLDVGRFISGGVVDSLTGTFNLLSYNAATDDLRLDFRYKNHSQENNAANKVWIRGGDTGNWIEAYDLFTNQNPANGSFKLTTSIEISDILQNAVPSQNFTSSFQVRWGQYGRLLTADNEGGDGYTFDDIRLYKVTDDMQMLAIDTPVVNSCGLTATTPVRVVVRNSRNTSVTNVPVQYRINGGTWTTENIALIPGNAAVPYTFGTPANLAAFGNYLIEAEVIYTTDSYKVNDTISINITNTPVISVTNSTPHLQDFETDNGHWYTLGNSSWEYGTPASYKINRAASGSKAWKTRLAGNYDDNKTAILYSPCYDVSTMTNPTLSFSLALDLEDCGGSFCDGAYVEYSTNGRTWSRLGTSDQGFNWYNKSYTGNNLWSVQNYHRWHVATIPLSVTGIPVAQLTQIRFRFVVSSDPAVNRDGVGIDDIHIYNNANGIYDGPTMVSPVSQSLPPNSGWTNFIEPGGKLVASVNTISALGNTHVQAYIHTGSVRVSGTQYYHNRNITVKPSNVNPNDSATVRFYFRDTETENLINATGCPTCSKPSMAYELGVTKYSDPNDGNENGTLADNTTGLYKFITAANTRIVPFDIGYYAEFKVKDFSEFWLNNGSFNGITPLPLKLLSFTARKKNTEDVLLEWVTTEETNVNRFEVEVAKGNAEYQLNRFSPVGLLPSQGNSSGEQRYSLLDTENNKSGVRYYRLKMIDNDGSFTYSPVRPVSFTGDWQWQVFPNPSAGIFNLVVQVNDGEEINIKVYDGAGRLARQQKMTANGFVQKIPVDLTASDIASGLYLLEVSAGVKKQSFRLIKQ